MAEPFLTVDDARMKLDSTICSYKGKPYWVTVRDFDEVSISPLDHGRAKRIQISDDDFSYAALPLGYMNYGHDVYYLSRLPARQNKAGLSQGNVVTDPFLRGDNYFGQNCMGDCIMGLHPPLKVALVTLENPVQQGVAIHRHVALKKLDKYRLGLFYRTRLIATSDGINALFTLVRSQDTSFMLRILRNLDLGLKL